MTTRCLTTLFLAATLAPASQAADDLSYNRDVRPILSDNCFRCHGPDQEERKAKLRLDVPTDLDTAEIIARISSHDPDEIMPPPESNKSLDPAEIETLKRWISKGTPYEPHWAFVPPTKPPVPADASHPIDHFVNQKLARAGLTPNPEADKLTLARRLYLDLIGLPPTPDEADAFAADPSPDAYQNLVDRLLASPHYGERWARHWLDLARYADTNGYEKDRDRSIWPFRDWVIRALNADMPFDQFSVEQLAGDMLPNPAPDQLVATGFHRNTMLNEEGGIDPLEFRYHAVADRVATTGTAWLGLTVGCAQCHTHKYDPITHHDYFGFMAYLNNADEPDYLIPDPGAEETHRKNLAEADRLLADLPRLWLADSGPLDFQTVSPADVATASGSKAEVRPGGSVLISGPAPETDSYTASFHTTATNITALRLEALSSPGKGPGRTPHGNFVLTEIEISAAPKDGSAKPQKITIASASADVEQTNFPVAHAFDGKPDTGWAVHNPAKPLDADRTATFSFANPVGFDSGTIFTVNLAQDYGSKHTIAQFRISLASPAASPTNPSREALLESAFTSWLESQRQETADWRTLDPAKLDANFPYLIHEGDGVIFAGGDTSKHDIYHLSFPPSDKPVTALRLEALPDPRLPANGPGTTFYEGRKGDFYLTEFKVKDAKISAASETFAKNNFGNNPVSAKLATDGDIQTGWSVADRIGERHVAVFSFESPIPPGQPIELEMHFGRHYASSLGKFRLSATGTPNPSATTRDPHTDRLLAIPDPDLTPDQRAALKSAFLLQAPELAAHTARIRNLQKPPGGTPTLVMRERPPSHPRPTFLHHRGEFTQPKEKVAPRLPEAIAPSGSPIPANRLEFARWLVSKENPLTARVVANRHWAALFGSGIVGTLDDFGMQGALPSHPDLLDWLAADFMDSGWSLKHLHRTIVTSAAYKRSSHFTPDLLAKDPANSLLARAPRFRLDAEIIRDTALRSAGILSDKMFGPPVRPPQPDGVTEVAYGAPKWNPSSGDDRFRRSLYTFIKRTAPFAMFGTFDAPSGEACVARRDTSNSALQALTLVNDPMLVEIAEKMGASLAAAPGDNSEKLRLAFRRTLTRPPTEDELALLTTFLETRSASGKNPWPALARALLALDESITRN